MNAEDEKRLAEIEARTAKATRGPWWYIETNNNRNHGVSWWIKAADRPETDCDGDWICGETAFDDDAPLPPGPDDGAFIAAAREDVPWLIKQLKAANGQG